MKVGIREGILANGLIGEGDECMVLDSRSMVFLSLFRQSRQKINGKRKDYDGAVFFAYTGESLQIP